MNLGVLELVGVIGTTCFALSGVPQMIKAIHEGHAHGVAHGTIWLWIIGEALMLTYTTVKYLDLILLVNYTANLLIVGTIGYYKYWPRGVTRS